MTLRYCGSAVRAFMWNMPAGWWEVKCCWSINTAWKPSHRQQSSRTEEENAQLKTQPWSRTNLGSEICNNLTHYVTICISISPNVCVYTRVCVCMCLFIYVCVCVCICVIITMCAHVTHLWHFVKSSHMVSWCPQLTLPVFTKSKLNNLPPANCYWVTSTNSLNWQLMDNR